MKHLILFIWLMASSVLSMAQTGWDSTHRPKSYTKKVAEFVGAEHAPSDIVFLGNSITAGTNWQELLGLDQARNRGISGDITFGVLERLHEVTQGKPRKVFLLIGINDISRNIPDSIIIHNLKTIVYRIRKESPRTTVYVQTLLPVNESFKKFKNHYHKDVHIAAVNTAIRDLAGKKRVKLIDLHTYFVDDNGKLKKELTHDGLHLKPEGYALWANILKNGRYIK